MSNSLSASLSLWFSPKAPALLSSKNQNILEPLFDVSAWPELSGFGLDRSMTWRFASLSTQNQASLKCGLFKVGHFEYVQHTHRAHGLIPTRVGLSERTVQAGIEEGVVCIVLLSDLAAESPPGSLPGLKAWDSEACTTSSTNPAYLFVFWFD